MAREEQFLGYGYSCGGDGSGSGGSGGGGGDDGGGSAARVSKKVKQKKVPQRGLGVAQLEKIRLEEQQKMEASNVLGRSDLAAFLPIPCPKFTSTGISDVIGGENLGHMPNQLSGSGSAGEMDSKAFSGRWPRLWSGEYSLVGEKQRLDHGFRCEASVDANFAEAVPVLPPLVLPRRSSCQFPRPPPSPPLMVNTSPGILRSSVARSQMELPSNQSSRDNYAPSWLGEEKIVGTKRPYPFSFESPQAPPPLHRNLSSGCVVPVSCRSDELSLSSDGSRAQSEPRNKCIREGPLSLSPLSKWSPGEVSREHTKLGGEFLTLAPPAVSPPSNSMHKRRVEYLPHEFESFASQESVKAQTHQPGPSGSVEQPFSFFPVKYQVEKSTLSCSSNGNDGKGETIDLNLKL